jgi:hypothetical protein
MPGNGSKTFVRVTNADIMAELKDHRDKLNAINTSIASVCGRVDVLQEREDNTRKGLYALGAASTAVAGWLMHLLGAR